MKKIVRLMILAVLLGVAAGATAQATIGDIPHCNPLDPNCTLPPQ